MLPVQRLPPPPPPNLLSNSICSTMVQYYIGCCVLKPKHKFLLRKWRRNLFDMHLKTLSANYKVKGSNFFQQPNIHKTLTKCVTYYKKMDVSCKLHGCAGLWSFVKELSFSCPKRTHGLFFCWPYHCMLGDYQIYYHHFYLTKFHTKKGLQWMS